MKKIIALVIFFAFLFNEEVLSDVGKSYENYQVLWNKVVSKKNFKNFSLIDGINFWNEGMTEGEGEKYMYNA